jgi:hypothetical protein
MGMSARARLVAIVVVGCGSGGGGGVGERKNWEAVGMIFRYNTIQYCVIAAR